MSDEIAGGSNVEMWLSRADETHLQSEIQRQVWEEIEREPLWKQLADTNRLCVEVAANVVTLTGTLPSYELKRAVGRAAARVPGVRDVLNMVQVELPSPSERV
jgi:osmotically-inducible protein OsmY